MQLFGLFLCGQLSPWFVSFGLVQAISWIALLINKKLIHEITQNPQVYFAVAASFAFAKSGLRFSINAVNTSLTSAERTREENCSSSASIA